MYSSHNVISGFVEPKFFAHWWLSQNDAERFQTLFVDQHFPSAQLAAADKQHTVAGTQFVYRVAELGMSLGACFALFESTKNELKIQEYSVSGTSLEAIFIALAQEQQETI
jgi:hypothetical protein